MAPTAVKRKIISTKHAPTPIGPYSQAVLVDRTLYFSGQMGLNPKTMELVSGGIEAETHQTLENIRQVLKAANCDFKVSPHGVFTLKPKLQPYFGFSGCGQDHDPSPGPVPFHHRK